MEVSRRAVRAVKRAELSGAGPTRVEHSPGRWPGAAAKFPLFGEVLYVGLLVSALSIPVVTIPLAFAVGTRHLRRYLLAEASGIALAGRDLRLGILRSLPLGLAMAAIVAALVVDMSLAQDRVIPGAELIAVVGWLGLAAVLCVLLTAARLWSPERGWLPALRGCWPVWCGDPVGVAYLLAAGGLVALLGWQLLPLVVPGIGCLVLALLAIPERTRSRE